MNRILALFFLGLFLLPSAAAQASQAAQALADKSDQMVVFFDEYAREIARFPASFGQARGAKVREGDRKTPEGDYMLSPARPSDDWGWFMPIDYPGPRDVARARSQGQPPSTLGGAIGLHGTGGSFVHRVRQSFGENWTLGCIAVSDMHIEQIRAMVSGPIPIRIQP
jgi:murein L,D-transpeptidase YafK